MNNKSVPIYSAVERGLCVLCLLAERIGAPKETASERMAIFLCRTVAFPGLGEERSKSNALLYLAIFRFLVWADLLEAKGAL